MDLNDGIAFELTEVSHLLGHDCIGTGRQGLESGLVELLSGSEHKGSLDNGEVLIGRVPVWGHAGIGPANSDGKG